MARSFPELLFFRKRPAAAKTLDLDDWGRSVFMGYKDMSKLQLLFVSYRQKYAVTDSTVFVRCLPSNFSLLSQVPFQVGCLLD